MVYCFAEDALNINTLSAQQNNLGKGHLMKMAHQYESLSTMNRGDNPTPKPTTLETSDVIITSDDSFVQQESQPESSEKDAPAEIENLLDSMADEYVLTLRNPLKEHQYKIGETEDEYGENEGGEIVIIKKGEPIYDVYSKEYLLAAQHRNLEEFAKGSFLAENLKFDKSILPSGALSMDVIIQSYVEDSIDRAKSRYQDLAGHPAHISFESTEEDPESTNKFVEVLSSALDLGAAAIHAVRSRPPVFSRPVEIISAQERIHEAVFAQLPSDDRALLNDPVHAAEVTQAINLRTIKPEDILQK